MRLGIVQRLYAYRFFDDFVLIYPLYQILFVENGLGISQISTLFIIWSVASLAMEVPSGVLADRYSRKSLLAFGQSIRAMGFIVWLLFPDFWGFAFGFILWGVGSAFDSGTYEALLYDELKANGVEKDYVKIQGRALSFSLAGEFLATALAAAAVLLGYPALLVFSALAVFMAGLIAWSLPRAPKQQAVNEAGYFADLGSGIKEALRSPIILSIIILSALVTAIFGSLEEYSPLFFQELHWTLSGISLGQAAIVLLTIGASVIAYRFENLSSKRFLLLFGLAGISLIAVQQSLSMLAPVLLAGFFFVTELLETILGGKLQHNITSHRRATITSVGGFLAELTSLTIFAIFGVIADQFDVITAFQWCGGVIIVAAAAYLILQLRWKVLRYIE